MIASLKLGAAAWVLLAFWPIHGNGRHVLLDAVSEGHKIHLDHQSQITNRKNISHFKMYNKYCWVAVDTPSLGQTLAYFFALTPSM